MEPYEEQEAEHSYDDNVEYVPEAASRSAARKRDVLLPISILVAAVLIGGSVVFSTLYRGGGLGNPVGQGGTGTTGGNATSTGTTQKADPNAVNTLGPRDVALGKANAPVTVIEYGDYQCPFCAQFFSQVEPTLKSQYIDTGKVKFVFRDFAFLGAESTAAGEAAECALDQGAFWAYHDGLYAAKVGDYNKGGSEDDGFFNTALFVQLAKNAGIDTTVFSACLNSHKYAATLTAEYTAAQTMGVNSTPTTFVNGKEVVDASGQSVGANPTAILAAVAAAAK